MPKIVIEENYSFDDLMLRPQYSTIKSRSDVDLSVNIGEHCFSHPCIVANMRDCINKEMCHAIIKSGGLAILHRFMDDKEQLLIASEMIAKYGDNSFAVSVGVKEADRELVNRFYFAGVRIVCIDIAHGDSKLCIEMCAWIKKHNPNMFIIAGNVATGQGAQRLWRAGADAVKVGIGGGSICSTRIQTGNGIPQMSALMDVANTRTTLKNSGYNIPMYIISDGGIRNSGDIVKACCFADMVMIGSIFASSLESPGKRINIDGGTYKEYVGSSTHKSNHIEGISALVPYNQESYNDILTKLLEGIRSGCSYQNAMNLIELKDNPEFVKISHSGLIESLPRFQNRII